jgi:hypothetical protein
MPRAGGGSKTLQLYVIGGQTRPNSPKENTVWVRTDVKVGEVFVQTDEPTASSVGDIWINSDIAYSEIGAPEEFGDYALNIADKIYIKTNSMSVKQWNGTTWAYKFSDVYKNKAWGTPSGTIYGAYWDGTSSPQWSRTDSAEGFADPVPYVKGASSYGSPFDNIMPWAGMVVTERTGGTMVAIPKFYYKLTQNGNDLAIQIANEELDGFHVSPMHMDRGDGKGERDIAYIGRYHCNSSYKSVTGASPVAKITRSTARTNIHNIGTNIWQMDWAARLTIWMLYIVEFAHWNSQDKIGYGCGNNSGTQAVGASDAMPYHTGTMQTSRTTYGVGVQYRNIEGLWDNVYDWCDGCYNNSNGFNIVLMPSKFSDSSGGISVGTPSSGYPSAFGVKAIDGTYPLFIPTATGGSGDTYSCDYWSFSASYPCVCVGGYYNQYTFRGLGYVNYGSASSANADIGCRHLIEQC